MLRLIAVKLLLKVHAIQTVVFALNESALALWGCGNLGWRPCGLDKRIYLLNRSIIALLLTPTSQHLQR